MGRPHQDVLSRLCDGWLNGFLTLFGCRDASERKKPSAFLSMGTPSCGDSRKDVGANLKYVPKQPRCDRKTPSTAASNTIKTSSSASAEVVQPSAVTHRRIITSGKSRRQPRKSRRHTRAVEEHKSCPSDDDDIDYKHFLAFVKSPGGLPPTQSLSGGTAASNEGHEQVINEQRGLSTTEESSNANEDASLSISDLAELDETDSLLCAEQVTSRKDVDSAMAWCALAAVLGSQAPSPVTRQAGGKMKQNDLWEMDAVCEDIPDLPLDNGNCISVDSSLSLGEGAPDLNEISFDESDLNDSDNSLFIVPDIEEAQGLTCEDVYKKISVKEAADSTLSWSALALLLGAPAPASVVKKSRKVLSVSDEGSSDLIPNV